MASFFGAIDDKDRSDQPDPVGGIDVRDPNAADALLASIRATPAPAGSDGAIAPSIDVRDPNAADDLLASIRQPAPEPQQLSFTQRLKKGAYQAGSSAAGGLEAVGELGAQAGVPGGEALARIMGGARQSADAADEAVGPQMSIADIGKKSVVPDFMQWAKEQVATQFPQWVPSIAGGAIGGLLGGPVGLVAGAIAPNVLMETGQVQQNIKQIDPNARAPGAALLGGTFAGLLDSIVPGKIGGALLSRFGKEIGEKIAGNIYQRVAKGAATGMTTEGITEAIQQGIEQYAAEAGTGQSMGQPYLPSMLEAGASGALLGGLGGGAEGALHRLGNRDGDRDGGIPPPAPQTVAPTKQQNDHGITPDVGSKTPNLSPNGKIGPTDLKAPPGFELLVDELGQPKEWGNPKTGETLPLVPRETGVKQVAPEGVKSAEKPAEVTPQPVRPVPLETAAQPERPVLPGVPGVVPIDVAQGGQQAPPQAVEKAQGTETVKDGIAGPAVRPAAAADNNGVRPVAAPQAGQIQPDLALKTPDLAPDARLKTFADEWSKDLKLTKGVDPRPGLPEKAAGAIVDAIDNGTYSDWLSPQNETTRGVFERATGVRLPKGIQKTKDFIKARSWAAPKGDGTRAAPIKVTESGHVDALNSAPLNEEPTQGQAEAGNYKKAHTVYGVGNLPITIENRKGDIRRNKNPDGPKWEVKMPAAYGYIKGTKDNTNEQADVYVGDNPQSKNVWVIDQKDLNTGEFDEPKSFVGFDTRQQVLDTYRDAFSDGMGLQRILNMRELNMDQYKAGLEQGEFNKPAKAAPVEAAEPTDDEALPHIAERHEKAKAAVAAGKPKRGKDAGWENDQLTVAGEGNLTLGQIAQPEREEALGALKIAHPKAHPHSKNAFDFLRGWHTHERGFPRAGVVKWGKPVQAGWEARQKAKPHGGEYEPYWEGTGFSHPAKPAADRSSFEKALNDSGEAALHGVSYRVGGGGRGMPASEPVPRNDKGEARQLWVSRIGADGERQNLGPYDTHAEAVAGVMVDATESEGGGGERGPDTLGGAQDRAPSAQGSAPGAEGTTPEAADGSNRLVISTGAILRSKSGRQLSPVPKVDATGPRKTTNTLGRVDDWLLTEARNEAATDDHVSTILRGLNPKRLSDGDRTLLNEVLFGDPDGATEKNLVKEESGDAAPGLMKRPDVGSERSVTETDTNNPDLALAQAIKKHLDDKGPAMGQPPFIRMANEAYGGTVGEGKYDPRRAYDAMETGANMHIAERGEHFNPRVGAEEAKKTVRRLQAIELTLPLQSRRTGDTEAFQQFSTPPSYGYAVNWIAKIGPQDSVLEPSAGNGNIAVFAKNAGAKVVTNEIGEARKANLKSQWFTTFGEDAEQIHNILPKEVAPTVVVMNPPFSAAGNRNVTKDSNVTGRHIDQALSRLKPGGRLVAIVGENFTSGNSRNRPYFEKWAKDSHIAASVEVSGDVYRRHGTTYPTRVLVIDKVKSDAAPVTGAVDSVYDLIDLLKGVRDGRPELANEEPAADRTEHGSGEPTVKESAGERRPEPGPVKPVSPAIGDVGAGQPGPGVGAGKPRAPGGSVGAPVEGKPKAGDGVAVPGRGGLEPQPGATPASGEGRGESPGIEAERGGQVLPAAERKSDDVTYTDQRPAEGVTDLAGGVYSIYRPQRLKIAGAKPHPSELVQSAAMASVEPPPPTYKPKLPQKLIDDGVLSEAQLESIVYAGQAHEELLGDALTRRGYFIGDGTGVGKGREIAGIIRDNFERGRKKAVWISEKWPLIKDAKRDWTDIDGHEADIFSMKTVDPKGDIPNRDGILYVTYDTMKQKPKKPGFKPRIQQIVEWLGKDFDGVLVFDEAHNMANIDSRKGARGNLDPSQKALAGVDLQKALPNARVVYTSATGATEVANLGYADRVGLWGVGTAFADKNKFLSEIESGGVAAMEIVARDMKQMGGYISRGLSFNGVEYDRLEHTLSDEQRAMYDRYVDAWRVVLQNIEKALEETGADKNPQAKSAAYSAFWGSHQRFFNQVLTTMQMPTVIAQVERDLAEGFAPVFQLVNTNEASQERALAKMEEGDSLEDLDITPRDGLMQLVENSFPVSQTETYVDENGTERSREVRDSDGNLVLNAEAVAMRDALLDDLSSISVPDGPLEMILNHFGVDNVAEVTGRSRRVVIRKGKRVEEARPASANTTEADAFMDGKKKMLLFSMAGGTGRSYHADKRAKNQRRRRHYLLQPGWSAGPAVQGFGRTHRSNEVSQPFYYLVTTDIKGQKRFISSVARRLDQLGALTKGERKTGGQGLFKESDNLESKYAKDAVLRLIFDAYKQDEELARAGITMATFTDDMGLRNLEKPEGGLNLSKLPPITQFLNRLLSLKIEQQDAMFDAFDERLAQNIEAARVNGTLDIGVEQLPGDRIVIKNEAVVHTDPKTGAETKYVVFDTQKKNDPTPWKYVDPSEKANRVEFIAKNRKSGRAYAFVPSRGQTNKDGSVSKSYRRIGPVTEQMEPVHRAEDDDIYEKLTGKAAERAWEDEVARVPEFRHSTVHMVTGALLQIWDRLPSGHAKVYRAKTVDNKSFLGRMIDEGDLDSVLERLGAEKGKIEIAPADLLNRVIDEGAIITFANGWRLMPRMVAGERRAKLVGPGWAEREALVRQGVQYERIGYDSLFFVPNNDAGLAFLEKRMKQHPVINIATKGEDNTEVTSDRPPPFVQSPGQGRGEGGNLSGNALNEEWEDHLLASPAMREGGIMASDLHAQMRNYLIKRGVETGNEAMGVYDAQRWHFPFVTTSNRPGSTTLPFEAEDRALDHNERLVLQHNHPNNTSLSAGDVGALNLPGLRWIIAHGHDGEWYGARLSDPMRAELLKRSRSEYASGARLEFKIALKSLRNAINPVAEDAMQALVDSGEMSRIEAQTAYGHVQNAALSQAGVITYMSSKPVSGAVKKAVDAVVPAVKAALKKGALKNVRVDAESAPSAVYTSWREGNARILADVGGHGTDTGDRGNDRRPPTWADAVREEPGAETGIDEQGPTFYSALIRGVDKLQQEKAPASQWLNTINNLTAVKKDEIEWSGVKDWLGDKKSVTKAEVLAFLKENQVDVREVEHRDEPEIKDWDNVPGRTTKYDEYTLPGGENYRELLLTLPHKQTWLDGSPVTAEDMADPDSLAAAGRVGMDAENTFRSKHWDEANILAHVRFDDRIQPTYTADQIEDIGKRIAKALNAKSENLGSGAPMAAVARGAITRLEGAQYSHAKGYVGVDKDGAVSKTLHVAEVQSDWHQKGRREGYGESKPVPRYMVRIGDVIISRHDNEDAAKAAAAAAGPRASAYRLPPGGTTGVPDAPFKTTWHELAMKRMLRYAAENGYDRLSWDTGETQVDRYDLSHRIKRIAYDNGTLDVFDTNSRLVISKEVKPEDLPDHIGKDAAERLMKQPEKDGYRELTGVDLKIGGEGQRGFYDKILPDFMNKYAKKWGAKVEDGAVKAADEEFTVGPMYGGVYAVYNPESVMVGSDFKTEAEALSKAAEYTAERAAKNIIPVHSIPITPAMRESVMGGQALFQDEVPRFLDGASEEDKKSFVKTASADLKKIVKEFTSGVEPEGNVKVIRKKSANDLPLHKKYIYVAEAIARKYSPRIRGVYQKGVGIVSNESKFNRRLKGQYSDVIAPLKPQDMQDYSVLMWKGDAVKDTFSPEELRQGYFEEDGEKYWLLGEERAPSEAAIHAYLAGGRKLFDKAGRYTDQHERKMKPQWRSRKFYLIGMLAKMRQMHEPEFRELIDKALSLHSKLRRSEFATASGETQSDIVKELHDTEARIYGTLRDQDDLPAATEFYERYQELNGIETKLQNTSVRRIKGYVSHHFIGSWAVYQVVREPRLDPVTGEQVKDENDSPVFDNAFHLIPADETGFHGDVDEAIRAANAFSEENKDANLIVKPVEFKFANAAGTILTDKSYWHLVGNVMDALEIDPKAARDTVSGVARMRGRRKFAGFKQKRMGVEGYSKNINEVFERHIDQVTRYVAMDEFKYALTVAVEAEGLSPAKAMQDRPNLARWVDAWGKDMLGAKQPIEENVDQWLDNRPWSMPATSLTAGAIAFVAAGGITGNPLIGALAGSYVGYRFYKALAKGGNFKARSVTGAMTGDMAHLKLGAFFNVFSPLVNLTQLPMNVYPILGAKYTAAGISRYMAAMSAGRNAKNVAPEKRSQAHHDYLLMQRADIKPGHGYADTQNNLFPKQTKLAAASMFLWNQSEQLNRGVAYLGAYQRAVDKGATHGAAMGEGDAVSSRANFIYNNLNKPEILRNILLRVPLQFKNYMAQQIAFMAGLDRKELPRFLFALTLTAGSLGLPFIDLLDVLTQWLFGEEASPITWMKKKAYQLQANGDLPGSAVDFILRGVPGLLGFDISTRAGMGDKFLPLQTRDFQGPWFSTLTQARALGEQNASLIDQIKNVSSGIGGPLKALENAANGYPLIETAFQPGGIEKLSAAISDGRAVVLNPYLRGRVEYSPTNGENLLTALGGTSIRQARLRDFAAINKTAVTGYQKISKRAIDRATKALQTGNTAEFNQALRDAREDGVPINAQQMRNAVKQQKMERGQRAIQNDPRKLRPEMKKLYDAVNGKDPQKLSGLTFSRGEAVSALKSAGLPVTASLVESANDPIRGRLLDIANETLQA